MEGRLKAAKDAAYQLRERNTLGKKCMQEVGKMIYCPCSWSYTLGMSKNTPPKKEARKIPKNFRLFAEDVRRLKLGAEQMGVPAAIYLQFALREKFKKDGIE
jgi:hypothetical protein